MTDPFAQATADTFAVLGVSAFYTPVGGSAQDVRVLVEEDIDQIGEHGEVVHYAVIVDVSRATVDEPAFGDSIEINDTDSPHDGRTFQVREAIERDSYRTRVAVDG